MRYLILLSGDFVGLGKEEIESLFKVKNQRLTGSLYIADFTIPDKKIFKRLSLTKKIYKVLFECQESELIDNIENFDWSSVYRKSFCVRIHGSEFISEKSPSGYIWRKLKKPMVDLETPGTMLEFFSTGKKIYCCLFIYQNKENFESRKASLRPYPHPSSLQPKIARALVNISGASERDILLDPFCGTGGTLIEAGLMGIDCIGYDIYGTMAKGCIKNLRHFKIKNFRVFNSNALQISHKFDCVVTDLPYGLNSNALTSNEKNWKSHRLNKKIQKKDFVMNLERFYLQFFLNLRKRLRKKAVIVFPDLADYKKLLKKSGFKIEKQFEQYVHGSLTRKIVRLKLIK